MREIKIYFKGDPNEFTTVYWQGKHAIEDIKEVLVKEDEYPDDIELKEVVDDFVDW